MHACLATAGLTVLRSGAWFHALTLPRVVEVVRERFVGRGQADGVDVPPQGVGMWRGGAWLSAVIANGLVVQSASIDAMPVLRGLPGLSLWALCQVGPQ